MSNFICAFSSLYGGVLSAAEAHVGAKGRVNAAGCTQSSERSDANVLWIPGRQRHGFGRAHIHPCCLSWCPGLVCPLSLLSPLTALANICRSQARKRQRAKGREGRQEKEKGRQEERVRARVGKRTEESVFARVCAPASERRCEAQRHRVKLARILFHKKSPILEGSFRCKSPIIVYASPFRGARYRCRISPARSHSRSYTGSLALWLALLFSLSHALFLALSRSRSRSR